jgi:16S rRNA (guanine966-N2)-methyltransferase
MRIIGGYLKGRNFNPPAKNWPTRPTTDISKEALFSIIENSFELDEIKVLDLFCGTGSHSYEFASRGCLDITSVDKHAPCIAFVKKMVEEFKLEQTIKPMLADAFKYVEMCTEKYDYIFAGPPYPLKVAMEKFPIMIFEKQLLKPGGWFVLEHNPEHHYENHPKFFQKRKYGQTIFSIFEEDVI